MVRTYASSRVSSPSSPRLSHSRLPNRTSTTTTTTFARKPSISIKSSTPQATPASTVDTKAQNLEEHQYHDLVSTVLKQLHSLPAAHIAKPSMNLPVTASSQKAAAPGLVDDPSISDADVAALVHQKLSQNPDFTEFLLSSLESTAEHRDSQFLKDYAYGLRLQQRLPIAAADCGTNQGNTTFSTLYQDPVDYGEGNGHEIDNTYQPATDADELDRIIIHSAGADDGTASKTASKLEGETADWGFGQLYTPTSWTNIEGPDQSTINPPTEFGDPSSSKYPPDGSKEHPIPVHGCFDGDLVTVIAKTPWNSYGRMYIPRTIVKLLLEHEDFQDMRRQMEIDSQIAIEDVDIYSLKCVFAYLTHSEQDEKLSEHDMVFDTYQLSMLYPAAVKFHMNELQSQLLRACTTCRCSTQLLVAAQNVYKVGVPDDWFRDFFKQKLNHVLDHDYNGAAIPTLSLHHGDEPCCDRVHNVSLRLGDAIMIPRLGREIINILLERDRRINGTEAEVMNAEEDEEPVNEDDGSSEDDTDHTPRLSTWDDYGGSASEIEADDQSKQRVDSSNAKTIIVCDFPANASLREIQQSFTWYGNVISAAWLFREGFQASPALEITFDAPDAVEAIIDEQDSNWSGIYLCNMKESVFCHRKTTAGTILEEYPHRFVVQSDGSVCRSTTPTRVEWNAYSEEGQDGNDAWSPNVIRSAETQGSASSTTADQGVVAFAVRDSDEHCTVDFWAGDKITNVTGMAVPPRVLTPGEQPVPILSGTCGIVSGSFPQTYICYTAADGDGWEPPVAQTGEVGWSWSNKNMAVVDNSW